MMPSRMTGRSWMLTGVFKAASQVIQLSLSDSQTSCVSEVRTERPFCRAFDISDATLLMLSLSRSKKLMTFVVDRVSYFVSNIFLDPPLKMMDAHSSSPSSSRDKAWCNAACIWRAIFSLRSRYRAIQNKLFPWRPSI